MMENKRLIDVDALKKQCATSAMMNEVNYKNENY